MSKKIIQERESLSVKNDIKESLVFNEQDMRSVVLMRIKDMIKLSIKDFCNKYGITTRTYQMWKKSYVLYHNIEPRLLYKRIDVFKIKDFEPYIDDGKLKLSIDQQLSMPSEIDEIPGFLVERKTVQFDKEHNIRQYWLKLKQKEKCHWDAVIKASKAYLNKNLKPIPNIQPPKLKESNLLTFYPLPDLHYGMLICKEETNHGYNYDLKIAKEWVETSMKFLVDRSPNSEYCVITDLGDFLHSSDDDNRTNSGHALDADQRHYKIVKIAFESMRFMLEIALQKHKYVYFYSVPGNHSEYASIYLKQFLAAWFKDNKRCIIPETNRAQQYHVFGKNILGFCHGHELKPEKSPQVMVYDNNNIWSETQYRYFHFGHFHSARMFSTPLCKVEIHNNMPPRDHYAESMGFRDNIGLSKAIVYHKNYGEISRYTYNLPMEIRDKFND